MRSFKGSIIFFLFILPLLSIAQSGDQRTLSTRIADVLARFPAPDKAQYDKNVDEMQKLGADGLQQMLSMLSPEGKGDNTALEYAISAYSSNIMQGRERDRNSAIEVYCKALSQSKDRWNTTFIVRQLQLVGNDASLSCLEPLLQDAELAGPAARAIAQVGTESAGKVLMQALGGRATDKASLIEALGYIRYAPAAAAIKAEAEKGNESTKKVAAFALARIADPSAATYLLDAAKKEKFRLDNTGATASYINYLRQLSSTGKEGMQKAATLANQLHSEATAAKNINTRIAALTLVSQFSGDKVQPLLNKAMNDADIEYRGAALKLAANYRNANTNKQWIDNLKNLSPEAKVQVIDYLAGSTDDKSVTGAVGENLLNDNNTEVRHAAIRAVPSLNRGDDAINLLASVLKKGRKEDYNVVKSSLLRVKADDFGASLSRHLDGMPPAGVATALDVLAARRSETTGSKVFSLLKSPDTIVANAAYRALPNVVKQEDLPQLFTLVREAPAGQRSNVQQALTAASSSITDTLQRTKVITDEMNKADPEMRYLFVPTLASIGGQQALSAANDIYTNGNEQAKKAVISALSKNKDARSASMLLKIAKESASLRNDAVNGYISIAQRSSLPAEQKVLMLQEAMSLAANDDQRKKIVQEAGRNRTYQSLVFAGKYLDVSALQQDAAFAIMNIALAHPEFNGQYVRGLLQKVSNVIKGGDSEYQKEAIRKHLAEMPAGEGFVPLFNGKDLTGWKGLVDDPVKRSKMSAAALADAQKKADAKVKEGWEVRDGLLVFKGHGENLATVKQYEDFEMLVDWKITAEGDAGIYLRGTPQVQIWDTSRRDVGAQVGSGGLYNNEKNPSKPLVVADNPVGEWNTFRIKMKGDRVTVYLNGQLVTDSVALENYWDRKQPIFPKEQIELQAHGTYVAYRNIYIKELPSSKPFELPADEKKEGFKVLFDGTNLDQWTGNKKDYVIEDNELVVKPSDGGGGGNLFTSKEYGNFIFRFEFMLTPGANNGLAIRAPLEGDAAYTGMELQILDNEADIYKDLKPYQYHGSVYGVIPAKRGFLKPVGEWNNQEVHVNGTKIRITLNATVILDGDLKEAREKGTLDKQDHPGIKKDRGHIGFLGHGSVLRFRNIRVKEL